MLRDELKNQKWFDEQIQELNQLNQETKSELQNNEIKVARIPNVIRVIFDFNLRKVFSMYSRGDTVEDIKIVYIEAIESYYDAYQVGGIDYRDSFSDWDFPSVLAMLCLGILYDIEGEPLEKLLEVTRSIPSKYKIINYFLSYFIEVKQIATPDKLEPAFKNFNKMIDMSNEEILSKKHMDKYLKWLKHHLRGFLTNTHNDFTDIYVGYWSFESAAFVKMRGLDDSSFRDSPYYPKDLL